MSQSQHSIVTIFLSFVFHICLTKIYWVSMEALLNLGAPTRFFWTFFRFCANQCFFELLVLTLLAPLTSLAVTHSLPAEGSLSRVLYICFKCPFFCLDWINVWILALIPLTVFSIWLWFAWFQQNFVAHSIAHSNFVASSDFEQISFWLICLLLLLVTNSVQLSPMFSQSATDCTNYDIRH